MNTSTLRPRMSRSLVSAASLLSLLLAAPPALQASTQVQWIGGNAVGNFSYNDNWNWGGAAPSTGFGFELDFISVNNGSQTSMYYDWAWVNFDNIIFNSGFPSNPLNGGGNGINFNQKIENDSANLQTINIPTSGAKNGSGDVELNAVNGDLTLNANVFNDNNKPFYAYGSSSKMLTVNTGLTGNNTVSLTLAGGAGTGYGNVKLTAAQAWGDSTHGVAINIGELWFDTSGSLASSSVPITVGLADGNVGKLWLSIATGGQTLSNPITVNNQASAVEKTVGGLNTSGTNTFNGSVTLNGQVNLSAGTGGAVIFGGPISGAQNVVINGYGLPLSGVIQMSGTNTYSGNTYVSGGTLQINAGGSISNSPTVNVGEVTGSQTATLTLGAASGGQTLTNAINVRAGSSGTKTISSLATSGYNTLSGGVVLSNNVAVNGANGGVFVLSGPISGSFGLTNSGSGNIALLGANTHTGGTTISGTGTITITNDAGLGTGSNVLFTASGTLASTNYPVTISATRTITVNSGVGAGFFTPDVNNLTVAAYITGAGAVSKRSSSFSLGTVRFSNDTNDYTGDFTAGYGNTEFTSVGNQGTASSLGKGAAGTGGLITVNNTASSATLRYVGTANSATTRPLVWTATIGGSTLDVTNTGSIAYLATGNLRSGIGTNTLNLQGSNTGTNTLAQCINDPYYPVVSTTNTAVSKTGVGTWVLSGTNNYSGGTTLSAGTLVLNSTNALGLGTFTISGTSTIDTTTGGPLTLLANNAQNWNGNFTNLGSQSLNLGTGAVAMNANRTVTVNANTLTVGGSIGGAFSLTKAGAGTLAIGQNATYSAGTIINAGIVDLTGGGGGSGVIRGTATVNTGGTLRLSVGDAIGYSGGASSLTPINITGGTLNVNTTANETLGSTVINLTGGAIVGVSGGNLDFFGGASALNALASATVSTISGVPISPLRQGSTTFTVAAGTTATNIDLDIQSVIRTSPSGDAAGAVLTKAGTGTLRLSAINTFAKPITVSAGELVGASGGSCANSVVTVSSGATNGVQLLAANGQWTCGGLTVGASGSDLSYGDFNLNSFTPSSSTAPLQVNGNVTFVGRYGIIVRNATLATGQYPLIKYTGTLSGTPPTFAVAVTAGLASYVSNNVANQSLDLVVTATSYNTAFWKTTSGTWDINTTANWTNALGVVTNYLEGNAVVFNEPGSASTVTLNTTVNPAALSAGVAFTNTSNYTVSGSGAIAGSAGVTKSGSGALTLATANTYSGGTILNAGTLNVSSSDTALGTGPLTVAVTATLATASGGGARTLANPVVVASGQTLSLNAANANLTLNGPVSGVGNLTPASTGTTTLGGTNTISGALAVNGGGTLVVATGGATTNLAGGITVSSSGSGNTLTVQSGAAFGGLFLRTGDNGSGNNSIVNQNGGTVTLTSASSTDIRLGHWSTTGNIYNLNGGTLNVLNTVFNNGWDGASTFNIGGGTANLAGGLAMGASGHGNHANGQTLVLTNGTLNIGASGISQNGTGPKTISLGGGTLGASATWSSPVPMTLTGTNGNVTINPGANTITLSGGLSGTGGLTNSSGTLIFTGTNTYAGPTAITAGTVQVISPGYTTLSGAVTGAGTLTNSTGTLNIGGSGTVATLSVGSPLASAGGALVYDLNSPASADLIAMTGSPALTLTGTTTITPANGIATNGTYTLINGAGTITGTAANLALGTAATNSVRGTPAASFTVSSPTVTMTISGEAPTNLFWQGTTSTAWDVNTTANWTNRPGGISDKFFNQDTVNFDDTTAASASGTNVILSTTVYPAAVTFNNSSKIFNVGGSGGIAGLAALTKSGTSLVTISNANSYVGGTTITAGTLRLATNNPNGLGTGPLTMTGGTLDLNSNSISILSLGGTAGTITDGYTNGGAAATKTLTVNQVVSNTFAGAINNGNSNTVALVKNGTNYLLLTGSSTFTGGATVNAGTLEMTAKSTTDTAFTVAQGATLKLGYSTISGGYTPGLTLNGNGVSDPAGLYLLGGKTMLFNSDLLVQTAPTTIRGYGSGNATLKGFDVNTGPFLYTVAAASGTIVETNVSLNTGTYGFNLKADSGASNAVADLTIKGVIGGTGSNTGGGEAATTGLHKLGTGSIKLSNQSTYSAATSVNAGSLILATNNALPTGTLLGVGNGATAGQVVLLGVNQTVAALVTPGTSTANSLVGGSATLSTLTVNTATTNTFNGALGGTGVNQNNLALVKTGAGQLVLSGQLTYTNNTTISAGTVWASSLTNVDGVTISVVDVAGSLAATNLTLGTSTGSTVAITGFASATSAPIVATNLVANGVTTITLAGSFTSGQFPLIQYLSGTKNGAGSFTVQQAGLPRGVTAAIVTNVPNSSIDVVLSANPLLWVGATNGVNVATWDNGTTTNWSLIGSPNYFTNNDNVQIDDTAVGTNLLNLTATVSPFAVLVTNSVKNYTISATGTSALTGGMSLTKKGTGLLTITESNSFSGGVTISGGAVNIQNGYAFNTNTVTVNSGTELELSGGINVAPVTALTLKSTGTNVTGGLRNVGGNNTYGGTITLSAAATRINSDSGTLTLTNGIAAGANPVTLGGSGTITISTGTVSGSGGLVKDGSGTNIWTVNPNISSGGVTVSNGLFQINNGNFGGTFTPLITINQGATLLGNGTHSTGSGTAMVVNKGTWLMNGEDYKQNLTLVDGLIGPGPSLVSAGADLRVGASGSSGSWTWFVSNSVAGSIINAKLNTIGSGVFLTLNVARGAATSDLTMNGQIYSTGNITVAGNGITTFSNPTNTYSGATTVSGGTLIVPTSQTGGGAFTNADGTTLGVNITTGNLPMSSLALGSSTGSTIQFLNFIGTNSAPVNATNLATAGTVTVVVTNTVARNLAVGQWPLIKYTGSIGGAGFGAFTLAPLPRGVVAVLVNNTANSSVDLNVLANDQITWNGNVVGGIWDTNNTANWKWNGSATTYQQPPVPGDGVLFDDTATGTTAVVLNQTVTPLVVVFNNSISNYTVSGSGAITGTNSLIKNGTNSVTLSTANTYTGTTTINAGTLNLGANFSPGSAINLSGGNLNLNLGTTLTEGSQVINFNANNGTIGTYGVGANAQINTFDVNSVDINVANGVTGASIASSVNLLTATYGTRIVVGTGSSLTMNGLITGSGIAGGILNEGSMIGADSTAVLFQGTGSLTLTASNNFTAGSSIPVTSIEAGSLILSGGDNRLPVASAVYLGSTANETGKLVLNGINQTITGLTNVGSSTASAVVGSSATLSTLTVNTVSNSYGFAGTIGGAGANQNNLALTKSGINTLTISGANTYTGNTTISAGTLALGATGSVSNTPNLNLAAGATLDVSAISAFALTSSNTLNAAGTASAATLNGASGGTVSLGSQPVVLTYDGSNPALTIAQGTLVLNGNAFTVNKATPLTAGSYNIVAASSAITSAGTYSVSGTAIGGGTVGTVSVSGNNVVLTIQNTTTTTLILSAGSNPSTYGDALTFQATVSPAPADGETITFNDGATTIGTGTTASGVATLVISSLPASGHSITASYPGDASNLGSTSSSLSQTVNPKPLTAALAGLVVKTYDGGTNATLVATNYSLPGVLGGDTVTLNNPASGYYDTKNQGTGKTVTVIGLGISGSSVTNYTLTSASAAAAVGVINTAALTVTATGIDKAYDGTTNATVTLSDNKVAGDTVTDSYTGASFATASVGTGKPVSVVGIAISGPDAGNYTLQNTTASTTANITAGIASVTVTSSANPAGFNDSVTFTATLPADATGNVVFLANGTAWITNALASGTNATALATLPRGTNTIEVQYGGDSNYLAATNDLAGGQVITNHPPVANNTSYSRNGSFTWKILVSDLLTNASDVDVDTLTLTGVGVSTNSITLDTTTYPGYVAYYNPSLVDDQFNYTVSDGFGGTNSGVITLTAGSSGGVTGQVNSFTVSGGVANMTFAGIPGYPYNVQRSTDLTTWSTIWTTNAPSNGLFQFNDNSAPTPSAYYRLMW